MISVIVKVVFSFLACFAPARLDTGQRMYSIADLHGDFQALKRVLGALELADVSIDAHGKVSAEWTGEDSILVSTGDSVDRGVYSKPIYQAFKQLSEQAKEAGGQVVNVLGNHELMNLQGDVRFVHPVEHEMYGGAEERARIWQPGSWLYDDFLNRYNAAHVVGDTLFVHGGLEPAILHYAMQVNPEGKPLDTVNEMFKEALKEGFDGPPSNHFQEVRRVLFGMQGPFWSRHYPDGDAEQVCRDLQHVLKMVGAIRMTVGHTIQNDGVNSRCDGMLILADTAISSAYQGLPGRRTSAVEYGHKDANDFKVVYFHDRNQPPYTTYSQPTHDEL